MLGMKPQPPVNVSFRPRGVESFTSQVTRAKGIKPSNAGEASQLIPLIAYLLEQVGRFVSNSSMSEIMTRNQKLNEEYRGAASPTPMATLVPNPIREDIKKPAFEPIPDEDAGFSDEDRQERVRQLKRAIKVDKLAKKDTTKKEKALKKLEK